ncbi:hypothetical protein VST63_16085 [Mycolicibacterium sp. 050232]|uniref:hypothetical protein n=1 Tax=Mycolicibacterium sp. 050232 TaxID=3113982 RepID=UPI002E293DE0|nr:hypothetical protein [Mycolicibacterium sp. 050232]MED5813879.1 hypothetical protein [Mycolicibacterium sp. 050232]
MARVAAWVGAGVFTAGVSAAMLAGAGTANADEDGASKSDAKPSTTQNDARRPQRQSSGPAKQRARSETGKVATKTQAKQRSVQTGSDQPSRQRADSVQAKTRNTIRDTARDFRNGVRDVSRDVADHVTEAKTQVETEAAAGVVGDPTESVSEKTPRVAVDVRPLARLRQEIAARSETQPVKFADTSTRIESVASTSSATPARPDPVEAIHDVLRSLGELALNPEPQNYPEPVSVITGAVFDTLATLERVVGGDPVVPPQLRDSVEVSTSTLVISEGHEVESNWYFPTSENGEAPTRLIYLQHGFLANGPLYSYTASYLAHSTNSVVVTTTYSSNPFEADGMWLGGDNLHESVAQLFLDPDRTALNASMDTAELKAGHTENLDVPMQFVLVGHSLGGGFAPGVAGYYAEGLTRRREQGLDAPNELAGVVIYDAVPMASIIPDAMDRLDELETNGTADPGDDDPNDYIPIYEIGAPLNFLNVFSDVNDQLSEARPGQFTGVVLEDGVHMDPMQGGNPLIQVAAYAIAGFPQPQNPLAVRELSAGWINDMFDEKIDPTTGACKTGVDCAGQYGDGDDTFTITTEKGDAVAVLIGTQKATDLTSLHAISATDFISAIPAGVLNGVLTTCDLFTGGKCSV